MALTDALSVACKALGVGADVYFANDKYETKYDQPAQAQEAKQPAPAKQLTEEELTKLLIQALKELESAKALKDVIMCWNKYPMFQTHETFKLTCTNLKTKLAA
jgi:hypothetical protein